MFIIKQPKLVLNPYEWLPGHGESKISLRTEEALGLSVDIYFDSVNSQGAKLAKRTIRFEGVQSFSFSTALSPLATVFKYQDLEIRRKLTGSLVEYEYSEAAKKMSKSMPLKNWDIRHYEMYFMSENQSLIVFAESCRLLE